MMRNSDSKVAMDKLFKEFDALLKELSEGKDVDRSKLAGIGNQLHIAIRDLDMRLQAVEDKLVK